MRGHIALKHDARLAQMVLEYGLVLQEQERIHIEYKMLNKRHHHITAHAFSPKRPKSMRRFSLLSSSSVAFFFLKNPRDDVFDVLFDAPLASDPEEAATCASLSSSLPESSCSEGSGRDRVRNFSLTKLPVCAMSARWISIRPML